MRSACSCLLAATVTVAGFCTLSAVGSEPTPADGTRAGAVLSETPVAPAVVGKSLAPVPEDDANRLPAPANRDAPVAAPASDPPILGLPPRSFGGPAGRSALHERLRARRMARVQQMRQSAEQNGDAQGVERAQYLEGMVNELHNQGLFNFAQKVMGAIQEGRLQGAAAGAGGASTGATEMPDAELGSPAPLPEADLGESAPLPGLTDEPPQANE